MQQQQEQDYPVFRFSVWERGGPDGDDKLDVCEAYGRVAFQSEGKHALPTLTLIVECVIQNGCRRYGDQDEIRRIMPALPISADWNREALTLDAEDVRFENASASAILLPTNEHQEAICRMADTLGVIIQTVPGRPNEFRSFLPNLQEPVTTYGTTSVYGLISNLPVTVDVPAFLHRVQDVKTMVEADSLVEQAPALHRVNHDGNKWPRELDHLIYDGMGQIGNDGRQIGSVRPT